MKKLLMAILALALLLTACGNTNPVATDSPQPGETTTPPVGGNTSAPEGGEIDREFLPLKELLESDPVYALVFSSRFKDPDGICLQAADVLGLLTATAGESLAGDAIPEQLQKELCASDRDTVHRLTAQEAETLVAARLGLTVSNLKGQTDAYGFALWEDGAYYTANTGDDFGFGTVTVDEITAVEAGTVKIVYHMEAKDPLSCTAILAEQKGNWVVLSNDLTGLAEREDTLTTDAELAVFEELFAWNGNGYANALTSFYTSPATADLFQFFYDHPNGSSIRVPELTESERAYYAGLLGEVFLEIDNICISATDAKAAAAEIFGITLSNAGGKAIPGFTYDPKHDAYIQVRSDTNIVAFDPQYAVFTGEDTLELYYIDRMRSELNRCLCVVTLREVDGAWQVVSNLPANPLNSVYSSAAQLWESVVDGSSWYLTLLASEFARPEEIDPWPIFSNQPSVWLTDIEVKFLSDIWDEEQMRLDVTRIPAKELDAVLRECTGISLDQLKAKGSSTNFPYCPDTGCYYLTRGGVIIDPGCVELLYCVDNWTELTFHYLRYGSDEYAVTLRQTEDGGWHMVSNLPVEG